MEGTETRKRGRPKVDTHLTEGHFDNRRLELNRKYMYEGTGILHEAGDDIPDGTMLYEVDDEGKRFKTCKDGILEQLGRMYVQDGASLEDCTAVANFSIDALKAGSGVKEITVAIRKIRTTLKAYRAEEENPHLEAAFFEAVWVLQDLSQK